MSDSTISSLQENDKPVARRNGFRFWIGLLISVFFVYLCLRKVDVAAVYNIILDVVLVYLFLSVVVAIVNLLIRAVRWKLVINPVKQVRLGRVFSYLMIGYMINNVLPFRVGELGRGVLLAKQEQFSKSSAMASVIVERCFDWVGLAAFLPFLLVGSFVPSDTKWTLIFSGLLGVCILMAFCFLAIKSDLTMRLAVWAVSILPAKIADKILSLLASFLEGMKVLRDVRQVAVILLVSILPWIMAVFATSLRFSAFDLGLPLYAALVCVIAVNFASALPSSPGQIGVAHYAYLVALTFFFKVDRETAVAFGIVTHALAYLLTTLPGAAIIAWQSIKLRKVPDPRDLKLAASADIPSEEQA
jgi:uncharacterized protein (TIRG00374 family)